MTEHEKFCEENPGTVILGNIIEFSMPLILGSLLVFCLYAEYGKAGGLS